MSIELDLRAFLQRVEAPALNRAEVDEHVVVPVSRDEAEAFRVVEPLTVPVCNNPFAEFS